MDKSLVDLKKVSDLIDKQREEEAKQTKAGKNEAIPQIQQGRKRTETLEQQLQELQNQEKQMNLKLKILKKKDELIKIEQRLQVVSAEDKFYTEKPDSEGYIQLREEKWEREFQDLITELSGIEKSQQDGQIDEPTAIEAKANITKKINKLVSVKKNTNSRNRMNKFKRGMNKVLKGVSTVSNEVGKVSNELGGLSKMSGFDDRNSYNSQDWTKFFGDESPRQRSSSKTTTKKKRKSKKKKGSKKKSKSRSKSTMTGTEPEVVGNGIGNMFEGF